MSGEEREGQMRELFGLDTAPCDICGTVMAVTSLRVVDSGSPLAEHDQASRVCPDCMARILRGELGGEDMMPEEDEPPPARE